MLEYVPQELRSVQNWVIWNINPERPKMPYSPRTGNPAEADDAATWAGFDEAVSVASRKGCGIGFEFGEPAGYAGIDIDHCIKDGKLSDMAEDIVKTMNSYTEYSPSGDGLHILYKLTEPLTAIGKRNKNPKNGLEMYDSRRYFTVTGNVYGEAKQVEERTKEARRVYERYMPKEEKPQALSTVDATPRTTLDMSDRELLEAMFSNPRNGAEIRALYDGEVSSYGSQSEADLALCNHLAYYTGNDEGRIRRLFEQSGLMRPKWEERHGERTYGEMTISKAIVGTMKEYSPRISAEGRPKMETFSSVVKTSTVQESNDDGKKREAFEREAVAYHLPEFMALVKANRDRPAISTGFSNLDNLLDGGLYPGLYFVGAISSLGKTTLALQIADSVAKAGHWVLIFSLEMARAELMAKAISRMTFTENVAKYGNTSYAMTTRGILRGHFTEKQQELVLAAIREYSEWGQREHVTIGVGDVGVSHVRAKTEEYIRHTGNPPVIVIDYLQILQNPESKHSLTDKQAVDKNVMELKRISRDYDTPVIGISSFNRDNYTAPVNMASFKESGAVEYSSDVLIGLQYYGWDRREGEKDAQRAERLRALTDKNTLSAKNLRSQDIQLKVLKNRNGKKGNCRFDFWPAFNYFREKEGE